MPIPEELNQRFTAEYAIEPSPNGVLEEAEDIPKYVQQEEASQQSWVRRHRGKLALGGAGVSLGLTLALNPVGETLDKVEQEAPAVAVGMVAMEAMWIGGAAMMLQSVGRREKNPFKIRSQMTDIATVAQNSKLFQAGFWINTTGAIGEFAIPAVVVCAKLPPESWGILSLSLVDLGATIALRKVIRDGIRENALPSPASESTND